MNITDEEVDAAAQIVWQGWDERSEYKPVPWAEVTDPLTRQWVQHVARTALAAAYAARAAHEADLRRQAVERRIASA